MSTLNLLCVHGIGHVDDSGRQPEWYRQWVPEIEAGFSTVGAWDIAPSGTVYDELFEQAGVGGPEYAEALLRLGASGVVHGIGDWLQGLFKRQRGFLGPVNDTARWTAGMVAQWASQEDLRTKLRANLRDSIEESSPNVILAHSLGTLACYDLFLADPVATARLLKDCVFISFGSQIGNACVRSIFGSLAPLPMKYWFHVFNDKDPVFTSPIRLHAPNFRQLEIRSDERNSMANHDAIHYLSHPVFSTMVWPEVRGLMDGTSDPMRLVRTMVATASARVARPARPTMPSSSERAGSKKRALLVGINAYPDPSDRLEGCVNDCFLMSSVLQECGFDAEDIRMVLDDRATAAGIKDRLEWLLEDAAPGDELLFYYSGHGAQLPDYGPDEKVDHQDECLCPWDFDFKPETAITDDWFHGVYADLPFGTSFAVVLDCCHSGGMPRGTAPRVRGMNIPDDIRHRMLRWSPEHEMWVDRSLEERKKKAQEGELAWVRWREKKSKLEGLPVRKLGRGNTLRLTRSRASLATKYGAQLRRMGVSKDADLLAAHRVLEHYPRSGPYMPVIVMACGEDQLASEYQHGAISHGAFTFSLAKTLRAMGRTGSAPTFEKLVQACSKELEDLGYDQTASVDGPSALVGAAVPWRGVEKVSARRRRRTARA